MRSFRSSYIETAKQFKKIQQEEGDKAPIDVQQLDFEFVLFASTLIDYDYIMSLIADNMQKKPTKQKMTKRQVVGLLTSSSNMMEEQEGLTEYINSLDWNSGQNEQTLRNGYELFKIEKNNKELLTIAEKHNLPVTTLKGFINEVMNRMIFDGEKLTDLLEPLELSWKAQLHSYNVGICFDFQVSDEIPTESFDKPMHEVWTERKDFPSPIITGK